MRPDKTGHEEWVSTDPNIKYQRRDTEWGLRKLMECNIVLSEQETIHTRKQTTLLDVLGRIGGINALLFSLVSVFFKPISQFLFEIDIFQTMFKI